LDNANGVNPEISQTKLPCCCHRVLKSGGQLVEGYVFLVFVQVVAIGAEVIRTWTPRMGESNELEPISGFCFVDENGRIFSSP
jgi:hypothetical protein